MSGHLRLTRLAAATGLACWLSACMVGHDFRRPELALPERYARADASVTKPASSVDAPAASAASEPSSKPLGRDADLAFWQGFGDAQLSRLITMAFDANQDVKLAVSRHDAANALLGEARFDLLPTITASGQVGRQLLSRSQAFGAPRDQRDTAISSGGINASWELDLFGRVRRGVESQRASAAASAADLRAVRVAIAADVASAYVDLRGSQTRLAVARENVDNQRSTLALVEARVAAGRGSELDAARARSQFESTRSRIAFYQAAVGVDQHRLAVLTGQAPEALIAELETPAALPALTATLDPGTPGELLRRRPDIAAAEARLHAATAQVGVATADLFPRFTLSGLLGSATAGYGVFGAGSDTHLAALGVDWSFLDVGRVRARIAASRADAAGQLAQYRQTVLLALEDTENALLHVGRTREESGHLDQAATDSTRAVQLARARFEAGAIGYYEVLDAQGARLQAEDAAVEGRMRRAQASVDLYRALAGGWD
ncbi:efflux transporter outer membrane subunit [Burkholderia sp. Cy-647]|uniref:efflux transporter outer membrane subunit n=1 Tax=unclassified Burkholderia TaxID=2613784 RepID=UPI001420EB21|nr:MULTISPECIES: efflux transporter outer membrane subunit [unclassified Burkholderia]NIF62792.1 efflux transporter outer membrane subunit [Burkholderia sp. Cy-647]NIF95589.1 efflux transporter outer membrane subunit [Burkholderia sp. Ax-1720]